MVGQAGYLSQQMSKDHVGGQGAELGVLKQTFQQIKHLLGVLKDTLQQIKHLLGVLKQTHCNKSNTCWRF